MTTLVIAYASTNGHTQKVAEHVAKGAESAGVTAILHNLDSLTDTLWEDCLAADGIIFGTPTYMGNASAKFQAFAEASGKAWFGQKWKDKIAAGFTNSGSPCGDKVNTLQGLAGLACQHSMVWVSGGMLPSAYTGDGKNHNRFGYYMGLGTQSSNEPVSATNPAPEDLSTAEIFGARVAVAAQRWKKAPNMQALTTTVYNLYLALVCAFSLLASVIIAGAGLSSMVNVVYPGPTEVATTRFDETTKQEVARDPLIIAGEKADRAASQRFYEVRSMLHSFVYLLLSGLIFAIHWRLFRRRVALADLLAPSAPTTKTKSK